MINIVNILRKRTAHLLHKKPIQVKNQKIISFTFDDVFDSSFQQGGNILKKYNAKGTFYLSMSFMKGLGEKTLFTENALRESVKDGHEMGGHTFGHLSAFKVSKEELLKDMEKNEKKFKDLNLGIHFENFAYPYGDQVPMVKSSMGEAYQSNRGITEGVNNNLVDLNNLKAVRLFEKEYSIEHINKILEDFNKTGGWLIFYTHEVEENYSQWGCSPKYFEEVVKRTTELNIPIKTIKEALKIIKN